MVAPINRVTKTVIPDHIKEQIDNYANKGTQPSDFILYVLCNNLVRTMLLADRKDIKYIGDIMAYVCHLDAQIWGSEFEVRAWLLHKREGMPLSACKLKIGMDQQKQIRAFGEALDVADAVVEQALRHSPNPTLEKVHKKAQLALKGELEESLLIQFVK